LGETDVELPPCDKTGLELVEEIRAKKALWAGFPGDREKA